MTRRIYALLPALMLLVGLSIIPTQASAAGQPTELLRYYGDGSSATGAALANTAKCDVNGDDYDDAVVGAWFWDKAPLNNIGAAYVLLGSEGAAGGSLNNPASRNAIRIDGPATANAFVGFAVGCLGDVNGDGFDDIAISHYTANKTYVVFGAEDFSAVDLGLLGSRGFEVKGDLATGGNVGFSLASVGDLDSDGFDDFGIAEVVADTQGRTNNGRIWVVAGQDDVADVDLNNPAAGQILMTVDGADSEERLGQMAAVGDVNGDGTNDFVVGSYTSIPWGPSIAVPGAAAVIWGGQSGAIDLASLGNKGFRIFGPIRGRDRLGQSVSSAGDVNSDGLDDLLIGADGVTNAATGNRNGSAWVVFGAASSKTVYTAAPANDTIEPGATDVNAYSCDNTDPGTGTCATPADKRSRGYWIKGAVLNDSAGYSVAGIGDVNSDGIPDFAIGAYGYDPVNPANPPATMSGAGAVHVVFGKADTNPQRLAGLPAAEGYRIDGLVAGDRFGRQVGRLGDFDGNGTKDFFAGGDFSPRPLAPGTPLSQAGEVTVALMGPLNTKTTMTSTAPPTTPGGTIDLTAAVKTPVAGNNDVNQGTVAFTDNAQAIPGCSAVAVVAGSASCNGVVTPRGGHSFVASFQSAAANRKDSASPAIAFGLSEPTTTTLASSANPILAGKQLTLSASVEPGNGGSAVGSGTVAFTLDGVELGDCEAVEVDDGQAACAFVPESPGEYDLVATYTGNASLGGSTSQTVEQTVLPPQVSTIEIGKLPAAPTPLTADIRLSALVKVDGARATTGTVTFSRDGAPIPACVNVAVDDDDGTASCLTKAPTRGSHTFGSSYDSGTISIDGSDAAEITHDATDASAISVSTSDTALQVGDKLKVDSAVTAVNGGAAVDEGRVRVLVDENCGSDCNTKQVVAGKAGHELTFSEPGTYAITGEFSKGQFLDDSESAPVTVTVTKAPVKPVCPKAKVTVRRGQFSGRSYTFKLRASGPAAVKVAPRFEFSSGGSVRTIRPAARSIQVGTALRNAKFVLTRRQAKSLPPRVRVAVVTRATTSGRDCSKVTGSSNTIRFSRVKTGN